MNLPNLSLRVIAAGFEADEVDRMTRRLRTELLDVDGADVTVAGTGRAPAGAKSAEAIAIGALAVAVAPVVVGNVLGVVSSWLSRQPAGLEIEIDGHRISGPLTRDERARLVAAYLRAVEGSPAADGDGDGPDDRPA